MGQIGRLIASGGSLTIPYAERLIAGVTTEQFARLARPGGIVMQSNHPAWVFGHLALYPAKVLERLGRPIGDTQPPPGFDELFKNGAACQDDPAGTIYPNMDAVTKFFFSAQRIALSAIEEADDAKLLGQNPAEGRMRELFPTLGSMLIFYVDGHAQNHFGQISAWRRAMGLPPA